MRIIGGKHRGYRFHPPKKTPARPTTDIAKEGLFNILTNTFDFERLTALDLFGGTGSISFELASRGCPDTTLVEISSLNIRFIKKMVEQLNLPIQVVQGDVFRFVASCSKKFKLIFAGPPYPLKNLNTIPEKIFDNELLVPDGWLILEHNPNHNFEDHQSFLTSRNYGTTIFSIFEQMGEV